MATSITLEQGARKAALKASPGRTLAEILSEFCEKFGLTPEEWSLNYKSKAMDLSLPFRLSGIPQNSRLEVVRRAKVAQDLSSPIQVGLQLASGERLVGSFAPNTSLWDLLQHFERAKATTFTTAEDSSTGNYIQPVLSFLNREFSSNRELRNTSLETLGLAPGSNGILRLLMRPTDILFAQFMQLDKESVIHEAENRDKAEQERQAKRDQLLREQEEARLREQQVKERLKQAEQEEEQKRQNMRKLYQEEAAKLERQRAAQEHADNLREQQKQQREEKERMWKHQKMLEEQERQRQESLRIAAEIAAGPGTPMSVSPAVMSPSASATPVDISSNEGQDDRMDVDSPAVPQRQIAANAIPLEPLDRNPTAFAPSTSPFDASSIDLPDDFFEMSPEDFAREAQIQADKKRRLENEKSILRTQAMREMERVQRWAKFKKCFIRVRFPDRLELQGTFYPTEKTAHVVEFVRSALNDPDLPFYLYTTPPMTKMSETLNLRDQGLLPASLVHFGLPAGVTAQSPLIKPELLGAIQEKLPPSMTVSSGATVQFSLPAELTSQTPAAESHLKSSSSSSETKDSKSAPKWFTAGLKKK